MELLLIFTFLMNGPVHADQVERLQKRESGYASYLRHLEELDKMRKNAAGEKKKERRREELAYAQKRRTFKRRSWVIDPRLARDFERRQAEHKQESLEIAKRYARQQKAIRDKIEERAIRLKYREYQLKR